MTDNDRYMHPNDPDRAEERQTLHQPLPAESCSESTIPLVVIKLELFMGHHTLPLFDVDRNTVENHRKVRQLFALDKQEVFWQEVLIEYDFNARDLEAERYAVTFTIATMDSNVQKSHALITIFRHGEVTMQVSDYDIPYADEQVVIVRNERMRSACEYDVEKMYEFMLEMLELQDRQESRTRDMEDQS